MTDGFDKAKDRAMALTDDANGIIGSVQDLVAVDRIDDTAVLESVDRGKKKVRNIVEDLNALHKSQVQAMTSVRADLQTMKRYLADVEAKVERGDLEVDGFSVGAILDIEAYKTIKDRVFGESIFHGPEIEAIEGKIDKGELLTEEERNLLYKYIQNIYFTDEQKNYIHSIAHMVSNGSEDKLKNHLNTQILKNKESLSKELVLFQMYMYTGAMKPGETHMDMETHSALETYSLLLKEYIGVMKDNKAIIIDEFNYSSSLHGVNVHYLEYTLKLHDYPDGIDRSDFRETVLQGELDHVLSEQYKGDVTYVNGAQAAMDYYDIQTEEMKEKLVDGNKKNFLAFAGENMASLLASTANLSIPANIFSAIVQSSQDSREMKEKNSNIKVREALQAGNRLDSEVSVQNLIDDKGSRNSLLINLYPSNETYERLERWKEVDEYLTNIDFPSDAVVNQDWVTVGKVLGDITKGYNNVENLIFRYILYGDESIKKEFLEE